MKNKKLTFGRNNSRLVGFFCTYFPVFHPAVGNVFVHAGDSGSSQDSQGLTS